MQPLILSAEKQFLKKRKNAKQTFFSQLNNNYEEKKTE